jgi:hypothetical protein
LKLIAIATAGKSSKVSTHPTQWAYFSQGNS